MIPIDVNADSVEAGKAEALSQFRSSLLAANHDEFIARIFVNERLYFRRYLKRSKEWRRVAGSI